MHSYNVADAKTRLSEILTRVEAGEEILLTRRGQPVARVIPDRGDVRRRTLGFASDKIRLLPGWDDPVTEEDLLGA